MNISRAFLLRLLLTGLLPLGAAACTTDQPKNASATDAGDGKVVDGGAPHSTRPSTASPSGTAPLDGPGGSAEGAPVDAGAVTTHAVNASAVDAGGANPKPEGTSPTAGANTAGANTAGANTSTDGVRPASPATAGAFDKILAKPKDPRANPEELQAMVEKKTGEKVVLVRRTAGKWFMFQFAPSAGGRSAEDQKRLVLAMKELDAFASVEADRLMQVKMP